MRDWASFMTPCPHPLYLPIGCDCTVDECVCAAQIAAGVERLLKCCFRENMSYLLIAQGCRAQISFALDDLITDLLDKAKRFWPASVPGKCHCQVLGHDQSIGQFEIRFHTGGIDLQIGKRILHAIDCSCRVAKKLGNGSPFRLPPSNGSFMFLRHRRENHRYFSNGETC